MFKSAITAVALACIACSASAAVFNGASFKPRGDGTFELDGFGRTSETFRLLSLRQPSANANAIVPFFDTWNIDTSALSAGLYSFSDLTIDAFGTTQFSAVVFNSIDADGGRQSILFDINAPRTQAVGSGTFTVLDECPIQSCVWIDVIGTQVAGSGTAGYGGTTIATPVPEPATYGMMALGLLAVGAMARRRKA